jgi:hypothetical protein
MDLELKGRTAIVCAASQGLGKASAMSLATTAISARQEIKSNGFSAPVRPKEWPESQASNLEPLVLETSARPLELHSENWSRPTVLPRVFLLHKQAS